MDYTHWSTKWLNKEKFTDGNFKTNISNLEIINGDIIIVESRMTWILSHKSLGA